MPVSDTLKERGNRYGSFNDNAVMTQEFMAVIDGHELTPAHRECLHMIFHKISRMVVGDQMYADNAHDIAGYATLLEEYINEQCR